MRAGWNRILVGIDLNPSSEVALAYAARLAEGLRASLVWTWPMYISW